jgi:hypothetical protein
VGSKLLSPFGSLKKKKHIALKILIMTLFSKSPLDGFFFIKYPQRKIKCYDAIYVAKSLGQGHY